MKIQLYGFVHSLSGPAVHTKEFALALEKAGADVSVKTHFQVNPSWNIEKDIHMLYTKPEYDKATTILIDNPGTWWMHMAEGREKLIGVIVFEGTCIPYHWALAAAQTEMNQIWCPSQHVKDAIIEGFKRFGFNNDRDIEKVKIVPHGYNPKYFHPQGKVYELEEKFKDHFNFLYLGGWSQGVNDRKGLDLLYRAFVEEFKDKEKVTLFAKITSIYNAPGYNPVDELKKISNDKTTGKVQVMVQDVPEPEKIAELYRMADVFAMPSKAEGFCMPCLESLVCGTPVLSNYFGGQSDYINKENGWLLDKGEMKPATDINRQYYDWANWFNPSVDEWKETLRYLFENQAEVEKRKEKAYDSVKHLTWENSAKTALSLLSK